MKTQGLVALTGGAGFLGGHITRALKAAGWRVRHLVHQTPVDAKDAVSGGLDDAAALDALVADADVVIHAAGLVKARRNADFFHVNGAGGHNLAAAVARCPRRPHVVVISSLAARQPDLSPYAASKRAGEDAFTRAGLSPVVLRPTAIYGPGDREAARFLKAAESPLLAIPLAPEARVTLVHATDVASAAVAMATCPESGGCVFELTDRRCLGYGWRELAERLRTVAASRAAILAVPYPVLALIAGINVAASRVLGRAPMLTPGKAREIFHPDWSSAPERQPPESLWHAQVDLDTGLAETFFHLRATPRHPPLG